MSFHQIIYNRLRQVGMTEAGALGCLGNWECESNCEPNRVQGDFSSYRTASKQYVADVTAGRISREISGRNPGRRWTTWSFRWIMPCWS